jgi:gamma-glutamylcyclotransferase (GGCT)/AIG2-like uncharacterized protein YtfP
MPDFQTDNTGNGQAKSPRRVFVYGTLRLGEVRDINRLAPPPRWIGQGTVAGVMHHLGSYPGIRLGGTGIVRGEVYEVSPELERVLDEIEEVWPQQTGEYAKCEVVVDMDEVLEEPGRSQRDSPRRCVCFLYEIAHERTHGMPVIRGGDWVQHRLAGG